MKQYILVSIIALLIVAGVFFGIRYLNDSSYTSGGLCASSNDTSGIGAGPIVRVHPIAFTKLGGPSATSSSSSVLELVAYNQANVPLRNVDITLTDGVSGGQPFEGFIHINEMPVGDGFVEDETHTILIPITGSNFTQGSKFSFHVDLEYNAGSSSERLQNSMTLCRGLIK